MIHVIAGPPCAGKSTHAATSRGPNDVVLDLDRLAQTLGHPDSHPAFDDQHPAKVAAQIARQSLLKAARTGRLQADVWVIQTDPPEEHSASSVTVTVLDPGADVCHRRAYADARPSATHAAIDAWYARRREGSRTW